MNNIQIFNNSEFGEIRTVTINGEPWFVGKDVATALGYSNHKDALSKHVDDEDKRGSRIATPSGEQQMTIINESGLYALIFGSKLESAKKFKHWVTNEVLPTIRKTGRYGQHTSRLDEMHLEAMRLIAECQPEKLPCMVMLLQDAGIHFTFNMQTYGNGSNATPDKKKQNGAGKIPTHNSTDSHVNDFLEGVNVINRPTNDVYAGYTEYCSANGIDPVSNIEFSKIVNKVLGTKVIQKKINNVNRRIFVKGRR